MEYKLPKILPEDVYTGCDSEPRLTGHLAIDIFAHIVHHRNHVRLQLAAGLMGVDEGTLCALVRGFSGINAEEWRDRYVTLRMTHLLKHTRLKFTVVGKLLGMNAPSILTRFCVRMTGRTPTQLRAEG